MRPLLFAFVALVALAACSPDDTVVASSTASAPPTTLGGNDLLAFSDDSEEEDDGTFLVPDPGIVDFPPLDAADLGEEWQHLSSNVERLDPANFASNDECELETPSLVEGEIHYFQRGEDERFLQLVFEADADLLAGWLDVYRELAACGELFDGEVGVRVEALDLPTVEGADDGYAIEMINLGADRQEIDSATLVFARFGDTLLVGIAPLTVTSIETDWVAHALSASAADGGLTQ